MKIVHTSSGLSYHLNPGTQLEIERPNLFFNDYGEQTLPVDLPDTDLNRELMGYPDMPANRNKPQANINCTILDGGYYMPCRQTVLGAKRKEKITTAFYMNEGSFLSQINKVTVASIFGEETVPGIETVEQGIDWCWSLRENTDENFAVFPAIVDLDGERRGMNIICLVDSAGNPRATSLPDPIPAGYRYRFFNAYAKKETVDGQIVSLSPGYYISPFIRANYLLKRIFGYFGYTLKDHFFTFTEPFKSMVFVNNTIDALVNGTILLAHLVPDCLCSTVIDIFRKKFCCEFVPDEVSRTVDIEFFRDSIGMRSEEDLTSSLVGHPEISFQPPRQLKLSSGDSYTEGSGFDSTSAIASKYPTAYYDAATGQYNRKGYSSDVMVENVCDGNLPYYSAEKDMDDYEVTVPDCQFCFSTVVYHIARPTGYARELKMTAPYIGDGRVLNSTIQGLSTEYDEGESSAEDYLLTGTSHDQAPILVLVKEGVHYSTGTNHDMRNGYSLLYNGPIGIYEKFYRPFDNLLRNSLHKVTASLLLTEEQKMSLPVYRKVSMRNNDYLIDILRYAIGGKNAPMETTLLTTRLLEPVSVSILEASRLPAATEYKWVLHNNHTKISEAEWVAAGYDKEKVVNFPVIYPVPPTGEQYEAGGRYYERTVYHSMLSGASNEFIYMKSDTYLSPALYTDGDIGDGRA